MDADLSHEEIVEQSAQVVQSGRLALLTCVDPSALSSVLGDVAIALMEFGEDVMRIDALEAHAAADLVSSLCGYLDVTAQDLVTGLRMRGEAGNPLCLVIDNAECLEGKALQVLRSLLESTSGGAGMLLGGEPDTRFYLEDAAITIPFSIDINEQAIAEYSDDDESAGHSMVALLPWRHLAAAVGLALLVWLFWPAESESPGEVRELVLPLDVSADAAAQLIKPKPFEPPHKPAQIQTQKREPLPETAPAVDPQRTEVVATKPAVPTVKSATQPATKPTTTILVPKSSESAVVAKAAEPGLTGLRAEFGYHQEEWLLTQAPQEWVLQVALSSEEDGARSLLDQIGRNNSAYYRAKRSGNAVYIVLVGPWASRDAAVAGKLSLPTALQALGPFPRELASVHQEIGVSP